MAYLSPVLRRTLEKAIQDARTAGEQGAADALRRLGVADPRRPAHLTEAQARLRNRLRAHARALGDARSADGTQATERLVEQAAYVQWHRLLFARFLLERRLLRHPDDGGDLTLLDCREEAPALGLTDGWAAAAHFTALLLPGVFPPDDPAEQISLAPEHARALRQHLLSLDTAMFAADDTLGWTYQFWRSLEKANINGSGCKIGAVELPAVTQLFTEPYMVHFLLHNTLGAWWAGKVLEKRPGLAEAAPNEEALREACSPPGHHFDMLRFVRDDGRWRPAAGIFPGWPKEAKAVTVLDPCCGSGHFLTEALSILTAMRQYEEGLAAADATVAVLQDNLFGLEIDGRCVQIAAFAVALAAWKMAGWRSLPRPHIAWSGAEPPLPKPEFVALANGNVPLRQGMGAIHDLFREAPLFGSLIEPTGGDLADPVRIAQIEEMLDPLVERMRAAEPEQTEGVITARGMADAAMVLAHRFTLLATNPPFLGRGRQDNQLRAHLAGRFEIAKADLATSMVTRMRALAAPGGTVASVTPQNWLFLGSYKKMREGLLGRASLAFVGVLGEHSFESSAAAGAFTALVALTETPPGAGTFFAGLDANDASDPPTKAETLRSAAPVILSQAEQRTYPDVRILVHEQERGSLLSEFASAFQGIKTGDDKALRRQFWERIVWSASWRYYQSTVDQQCAYGGCDSVLFWGVDGEQLARRQGLAAFGKAGVAVSQMRAMPVAIYTGAAFDSNVSPIVPHAREYLLPIWAFCSSPEYTAAIRRIDRTLKVTNATLVKVPFNLARWQKMAAEKYPNGLPEPYSDDPTQWQFHGHPAQSKRGAALHVVLARLCGYRWPAEIDAEMRLSLEARDWIAKAAALPAGGESGLRAIPATAGERSLVDRVRAYLAVCFGDTWSDALERRLVADADEVLDNRAARDGSLDAWLRDRAFRQHFTLFRQRPFLWHIWDGQSDGFAAFLHYHRLTKAALEELTYSLLGDWLARMRNTGDNRRLEAGLILQQKLEAILKGETPLDIFIRWKPIEAQPIGWNPDLDDGVRLNIRPFVRAGILRDPPNINWRKDRGTDAATAPWHDRFNGERINDHTLTLADKQAARR